MAAPTRATQRQLFVHRPPSTDAITINARCMIRTHDGHRVIVAAGVPLAHYALDDHMAEAHAIVSLVEQGWADQLEVARAFGCSARTVRRHQRRFEHGGLAALGRAGGYPKGRPRARRAQSLQLGRWKAGGMSNRMIAQRLGISEKAVRTRLRRLGWRPRGPQQISLDIAGPGADPNLSAFRAGVRAREPNSPAIDPGAESKPPAAGADPNLSASAPGDSIPISLDTDPSDRRLDRLLAYLGMLDDATPLFRSGCRVPRAGVLLAVPALCASGVLDCASETYGSLGPAFYGLRTTIVALVLLALVRIKRPEALKEHCPRELGRLLGLDRAPEVKTLRRKLARLARTGRAASFGRALAQRRVAARGSAIGFLYVDGHVRVYHGKHSIPKAHVARMRLSLPSTTDYWVNDRVGDPLFVLTAEANAGLVKMLPPILAEVRTLVGERRVTVGFDRGGFSPKLFQQIVADGFDVLTYRKGRSRRVARRHFQRYTGEIDGRKADYLLADQSVRFLRGKLRLRQVTRLTETGHQTPILTSRRDLGALEVAFRMFDRWRQENFFKYLREEYALDALVDYAVDSDDETREVPNPRRKALDAEVRKVRCEIQALSAMYGLEAISNPEQLRKTMRGFKIAHAKEGREVLAALQRFVDLQAKRASVPARIPIGKLLQAPVVKLATERKHLSNLLKMVAYQIESDLVRLLEPHYKRVLDEGRTLMVSALSSAADLIVTDTELRVVLAPLSSGHRSRAIAAVCEQLNLTATRFPGTRLVLRYEVEQGD